MKNSFLSGFAAFVLVLASCAGGAEVIRLRVEGPAVDAVDLPVKVELRMKNFDPQDTVEMKNSESGKNVPGQLIKGQGGQIELWWVIPEVKAGAGSVWTATIKSGQSTAKNEFSWKDKKGEYADLMMGDTKIARFMYAHDTSSSQRRFETYKPLLHVYGTDGQRLTNGPDGQSEYKANEIRYPHHRGIFIGWNKTRHDGQSYDLWHMKDVEQVCRKLELVGGPVLARCTAAIDWNDKQGKAILVEERRMTILRQSDAEDFLLDFNTELKAVRGDVFLGGDPEHAGFQYRAHNAVAKGPKEGKAQYTFHKDGIDAHKVENLPWAAMTYKIGDNRYSVLHMNHPDNPEPSKYSAYRDYGRFGAFFTKEIPAGQSLELQYRIWLTEGPMPQRSDLAARQRLFADAPEVKVASR